MRTRREAGVGWQTGLSWLILTTACKGYNIPVQNAPTRVPAEKETGALAKDLGPLPLITSPAILPDQNYTLLRRQDTSSESRGDRIPPDAYSVSRCNTGVCTSGNYCTAFNPQSPEDGIVDGGCCPEGSNCYWATRCNSHNERPWSMQGSVLTRATIVDGVLICPANFPYCKTRYIAYGYKEATLRNVACHPTTGPTTDTVTNPYASLYFGLSTRIGSMPPSSSTSTITQEKLSTSNASTTSSTPTESNSEEKTSATRTSSSTNTASSSKNESSSAALGSGAIVGIVLGAVFLVCFTIVLIAWLFTRNRHRYSRPPRQDPPVAPIHNQTHGDPKADPLPSYYSPAMSPTPPYQSFYDPPSTYNNYSMPANTPNDGSRRSPPSLVSPIGSLSAGGHTAYELGRFVDQSLGTQNELQDMHPVFRQGDVGTTELPNMMTPQLMPSRMTPRLDELSFEGEYID